MRSNGVVCHGWDFHVADAGVVHRASSARKILSRSPATGRVLGDAAEANRGRRYAAWIRLRPQPKTRLLADRPSCDKCLPNRTRHQPIAEGNALFGPGQLL